ncbi:MAG: glycosyltransferase, partial [Bullifex sp.]
MCSEKPLVSILVVSYNNTKYLPNVLESIFNQDYPNIEVLIGDDASTNFDKEQLVKWIDIQEKKRPTQLIINGTNKGTVKNLSNLHKKARGEYLFNIAADDVLFDNTIITKFYNATRENENKLWFVAETQLWNQTLTEQIGSFITPKEQEFIKKASAEELFSECCHRVFLPASYFYKKDLLNYIGDLSNYRLVEDWPAQIRLLRQGIIPVFVDSITSSIKHRDGGISHGNTRGQTRGIIMYRNDIVNIFSYEVIPFLDTMPVEQAS